MGSWRPFSPASFLTRPGAGKTPVAPTPDRPWVTLQVSAPGRCWSAGGTRGRSARGEGRRPRVQARETGALRPHAPPRGCTRPHFLPEGAPKPALGQETWRARGRGRKPPPSATSPQNKSPSLKKKMKRGVKGTSSNRAQQSRETSLWGRRAGRARGAEEAQAGPEVGSG